MNSPGTAGSAFPHRIASPSGLRVEVNANGSLRRLDHGDILINLFPGSEIEGGPTNLFLRLHGATIETVPLLGPRSPARVHGRDGGFEIRGQWRGIRFEVSLVIAAALPAWFWHVAIANTGAETRRVDLIHTQDLGIAQYWAVRINEYYTSHYIDHTALCHRERGVVVASRQNLSMGGRNPWTVIGALGRGVAYATDALQFHGLATRANQVPPGLASGLPACRRQHEHSMVAIQDAVVSLASGATVERGFFGCFAVDHPAVTSDTDLALVDQVLALPEAARARHASGRDADAGVPVAATLFSAAPVLDAFDLSAGDITNLFGSERRETERTGGRLTAFFTGAHRHVVLKDKELHVLRPHVHILRTGSRLVPDEAALTSTVWMAGVFHSMVTQGHVGINRLLSTVHGYLGMLRADGQRLFAEIDGAWHLLDVPSAFEISPQACRWFYKHHAGIIAVRSAAPVGRHELTLEVEVLTGPPLRLLVSHHVAINDDDGSGAGAVTRVVEGRGIVVRPSPGTDVGRRFPHGGFRLEPLPGTVIEALGGDELLFADGRSRDQPFVCLVLAAGRASGLRITGRLIADDRRARAGGVAGPRDDARYWADLTGALSIAPPPASVLAGATRRLVEILPWFMHNALVHYLAPRGVEQFTGGGWGTRDICQGPVEMLLAIGRFAPVRDLLVQVFRAQNADGDWPQWFTFFERERNIRAGDSHGDIVFWPLVALAGYLGASGDASLLEEAVPFFHPEGDYAAEHASILQHVDRALGVIANRVVPGTRLAAYGHGDWNDSMQPFDPGMRERLCSAWTVTLHAQALSALASAFRRLGRDTRAAACARLAAGVRAEFQRTLVVDGCVPGYAYFHADGRVDYLLHPRDRVTGVGYSLLPMIHAIINDVFTREQARAHLDLIGRHLTGPDGARLFDRPMVYRGGTQKYFQRAETAAYFGREIGLMYTHAHLRYAEALAHYGDADGFFRALCQANPIAIETLVPAAGPRQANCYYSSSDADFADRYRASAEYTRIGRHEVGLEGGWRVYSSGAGIWTRLFIQGFLGVRREQAALVIDPVIPRALDGLVASMNLDGQRLEIAYYLGPAGTGPLSVHLNGETLAYTRAANPYRAGAAEISMAAVRARLRAGVNRMLVHLG